jgi:hypothetical protein
MKKSYACLLGVVEALLTVMLFYSHPRNSFPISSFVHIRSTPLFTNTFTWKTSIYTGIRIIKTKQNDRNLLNGNNMADSFEKQQPVGAKEEETDARLLRLVA